MMLGENAALPLGEFTRLTSAEIADVVALKLSLVGLAGFEEFYPAELRGGMMKRAGLARAVRSAGDAFHSADVTLRHMDTQVAAVGGRAGAALDAAREVVRKVDREVEPLAASVGTAFGDAGRLVRNVDREVEPVAESLRTALDAARDLMRKVDGEIDPLVVDFRKALHSTRTAGESAQDALAMVTRALDGETRLGDDLSQALRQLAGAARSLNVLADYLQRHPEALLRGKEGRDAK